MNVSIGGYPRATTRFSTFSCERPSPTACAPAPSYDNASVNFNDLIDLICRLLGHQGGYTPVPVYSSAEHPPAPAPVPAPVPPPPPVVTVAPTYTKKRAHAIGDPHFLFLNGFKSDFGNGKAYNNKWFNMVSTGFENHNTQFKLTPNGKATVNHNQAIQYVTNHDYDKNGQLDIASFTYDPKTNELLYTDTAENGQQETKNIDGANLKSVKVVTAAIDGQNRNIEATVSRSKAGDKATITAEGPSFKAIITDLGPNAVNLAHVVSQFGDYLGGTPTGLIGASGRKDLKSITGANETLTYTFKDGTKVKGNSMAVADGAGRPDGSQFGTANVTGIELGVNAGKESESE